MISTLWHGGQMVTVYSGQFYGRLHMYIGPAARSGACSTVLCPDGSELEAANCDIEAADQGKRWERGGKETAEYAEYTEGGKAR